MSHLARGDAEEAEPAKGAGARGAASRPGLFKNSERLPVNPNDPMGRIANAGWKQSLHCFALVIST